MAKHTIRATGRFARASVTSGGNFAGAATSTTIGTGIDIATGTVTHPKTTELITLVHPKTGVAQNLIWREGVNISYRPPGTGHPFCPAHIRTDPKQ